MCNTNSDSSSAAEAHLVALVLWMDEHPYGSYCGQPDPTAYCGKPFVRACDYHDHQFALRSEAA
jgi:hypothetical protein